VSRDGVNSLYCKAELIRQLYGMLSLSAAEVYHTCPRRQAKLARNLIKQLGSAGMQALVEGRPELGLNPWVGVVELVKE